MDELPEPEISMEVEEAPIETNKECENEEIDVNNEIKENTEPNEIIQESQVSEESIETAKNEKSEETDGTEESPPLSGSLPDTTEAKSSRPNDASQVPFPLTEKELKRQAQMFSEGNTPVQCYRVHCTACNVHLGSAVNKKSNRYIHPLLRVLICKSCYDFYTSGEFVKDEDGSELYCRWCGQGGNVMCCAKCCYVFCQKCIRQNKGRKTLHLIKNSDDWNCFVCDPDQLLSLRVICTTLYEFTEIESRSLDMTEDDRGIDFTTCCKPKPPAKKRIKSSLTDDTEYCLDRDYFIGKKQKISLAHQKKFNKDIMVPDGNNGNEQIEANWATQEEDEVVCTPDLLSLMTDDDLSTTEKSPEKPAEPPNPPQNFIRVKVFAHENQMPQAQQLTNHLASPIRFGGGFPRGGFKPLRGRIPTGLNVAMRSAFRNPIGMQNQTSIRGQTAIRNQTSIRSQTGMQNPSGIRNPIAIRSPTGIQNATRFPNPLHQSNANLIMPNPMQNATVILPHNMQPSFIAYQPIRPLNQEVSILNKNVRPYPQYQAQIGVRPLVPLNQAIRFVPIPPQQPSQGGTQEWFDKAAQEVAGISGKLTTQLVELSNDKNNASSIEQMATIHNKLQELLSTTVNAIIQVRKSLRAEFLKGLNKMKFSQPTPLIATSTSSVSGLNNSSNSRLKTYSKISSNSNLAISSASGSTSGLTSSSSFKTKTVKIKKSNSPPPLVFTANSDSILQKSLEGQRPRLKVKSIQELSNVPAECITIPDDSEDEVARKADRVGERSVISLGDTSGDESSEYSNKEVNVALGPKSSDTSLLMSNEELIPPECDDHTAFLIKQALIESKFEFTVSENSKVKPNGVGDEEFSNILNVRVCLETNFGRGTPGSNPKKCYKAFKYCGESTGGDFKKAHNSGDNYRGDKLKKSRSKLNSSGKKLKNTSKHDFNKRQVVGKHEIIKDNAMEIDEITSEQIVSCEDFDVNSDNLVSNGGLNSAVADFLANSLLGDMGEIGDPFSSCIEAN